MDVEQRAEREHRRRHDQGTGDEQRLAPQPVDRDGRDQGEECHRHADEPGGLGIGLALRGAHVLEHVRREIEHRVDADDLLEDRQHDADDQHQPAIAEQRTGVLDERRLDLLERRVGIAAAEPLEKRERFRIAVLEHEKARCFRHQQHEEDEQGRRDRGRGEHVAPAVIHEEIVVAKRLHEVVHEIDEVDADDDGDLLQGDEQPARRRRRDLGDVHRRQHRGHADRGAAHQAVEDEERQRIGTVRAETELRKARADRGHEEQHARHQEAGAAAPAGGDRACDRSAEHAAQKRAADRETGEEVRLCLGQMARRNEVEGDRICRAGDHGGVVAEQQSAQRGGDRQRGHKSVIGLRHYLKPLPLRTAKSVVSSKTCPHREVRLVDGKPIDNANNPQADG